MSNAVEQTFDARMSALAGTRMLITEEAFDAIVGMLVMTGAVARSDAAVMLHRLSRKLLDHANGRSDTVWHTVQPELIEQASRLQACAVALEAHRQ